jgi:hypothetical protein
MTDTFAHVPTAHNLQSYLLHGLGTGTNDPSEAILDIIEGAYHVLETAKSGMSAESFAERSAAYDSAVETYIGGSTDIQAHLQKTFADWPAPLAQEA